MDGRHALALSLLGDDAQDVTYDSASPLDYFSVLGGFSHDSDAWASEGQPALVHPHCLSKPLFSGCGGAVVRWTQGSPTSSKTASTYDNDSAQEDEKLLSQACSTHSHSDSDEPGTPKTIPLESLVTYTKRGAESFNAQISSEMAMATSAVSLTSTLACHPPDAPVTLPNPFSCVWALEHVKPRLVWCKENADSCPTLHGYNLCEGYRYGTAIYFPTAVKFTRWLFSQRRGNIVPWCILITGWREAQPCAAAIAAARTGETSGLRLDARRPPLQEGEATVELDAKQSHSDVQVAIASMVVIPQQGRQEFNAMRWAEAAGENAKVPIHVMSSGKQASERLRSLSASFVISPSPTSQESVVALQRFSL